MVDDAVGLARGEEERVGWESGGGDGGGRRGCGGGGESEEEEEEGEEGGDEDGGIEQCRGRNHKHLWDQGRSLYGSAGERYARRADLANSTQGIFTQVRAARMRKTLLLLWCIMCVLAPRTL